MKKIKTKIDELKTEKTGEENGIRPHGLREYIGQEKLKGTVQLMIESAKIRNVPVDHMLFYGQAGLGKTTLAGVVANEMGAKMTYLSGATIEKAGDIASVLAKVQENDVVFIDEIHRMDKSAEEILYTAMEDFFVNITIGQGMQSKQIKLEIPKFTLIGATTRSDMLSKPLRDRFGLSYRMELYTTEELQEIAMRTASIFNIEMRKDGALLLAENARGTPRIVNKYVARARDIAVVEEVPVDANVARQALDTLGVVNDGLDETDILILERLAEFSKPIGLNTLANIIGEDTETIEGVYEPYLLKTGLILKTPKGRIISEKGANLVHRNTPSYPIQQAFA